MEEKKLKALSEIQRALGMLEGFSYAVDAAIAEGIVDAVAIIVGALEEVHLDERLKSMGFDIRDGRVFATEDLEGNIVKRGAKDG